MSRSISSVAFPRPSRGSRGRGASVLGLSGLVVMELLQGCQNKAEQLKVERFCQPHRLSWVGTGGLSHGGLADHVAYHLSHGVGVVDVLIGHTAVGSESSRWRPSTSSTIRSSPD